MTRSHPILTQSYGCGMCMLKWVCAHACVCICTRVCVSENNNSNQHLTTDSFFPFQRCWCWPNNPNWWTDSHHSGCKGCWERQSDMQRVHSGGSGTRRGCCWKWGWHVWHLLHGSAAWRVYHLCPLWRRAHPQQSLPSHGEPCAKFNFDYYGQWGRAAMLFYCDAFFSVEWFNIKVSLKVYKQKGFW